MKDILKKKKLLVFDLDKTLAESKQPMDDAMADLLRRLLERTSVAVISGGSFTQFQKQFVPKLQSGNLESMFLFPTCGAAFYRFENGAWKNVYTETLTPEQKRKIFDVFASMFAEVGFKTPEPLYGVLIEDRETQVTFSAHGSTAPLSVKEVWDPDRSKRLSMIKVLERHLPEFEIRTGGSTSIDVTQKGIDKGYGVMQMEKHLRIDRPDMMFIGDDLGEGGNDFAVIGTGIDVVAVEDPDDTKRLLKKMLKQG